jgi:CRP-like cAMP-binding protein
VIVARNSVDRAVHFIVSGHVRVTTFSPSGRQVTFRDEPAGEIFGDLAAIDTKERSADVLAIDSVLVAALSPQDFRNLIDAEPMAR